MSDYWYAKKNIPAEEKSRIKQLVKGEVIGSVQLGCVSHALLKVEDKVFREVFNENRRYLYKGDFTAPADENDYVNSFNCLTDDGLAGFAVTSDGWLVSLFSNCEEKGFAEQIKPFIKDAYKLVLIVADHDKDNSLVRLYQDVFGFRKYVMTTDDSAVMRKYYGDEFVDEFIARNGIPSHIFMIGENAAGTDENLPLFYDYFMAESFVEKTVRKIE